MKHCDIMAGLVLRNMHSKVLAKRYFGGSSELHGFVGLGGLLHGVDLNAKAWPRILYVYTGHK